MVRNSRVVLCGQAYGKLNHIPKLSCSYRKRECSAICVKYGGGISELAQKTQILWTAVKLGLGQGKWLKPTGGAIARKKCILFGPALLHRMSYINQISNTSLILL